MTPQEGARPLLDYPVEVEFLLPLGREGREKIGETPMTPQEGARPLLDYPVEVEFLLPL